MQAIEYTCRHSRLSASELRSLRGRTFSRAREANELGGDSRALQRLVDEGTVKRVARGLYHFTDADPTEFYTLAAVYARAPGSVVCLLSALSVHGVGTQLPREVCIAIPHSSGDWEFAQRG